MENRSLKVVSWNVYALNPHLDHVLDFIQRTEFDVFCLQEVSEELLSKLRELPYYLVSAVDRRWQTDAWHPERGKSIMYLVILSNHAVTSTDTFPQPALPTQLPWQTHFFYVARYLIGMWRGGSGTDSEVIFADIAPSGKPVRVWCTHLALYTPQIRARELQTVLTRLDHTKPNIVCGDFNILDFWPMRLLNWLQGGRLYDAMPWTSERKSIEALFAQSNLKNPLRGHPTHPVAHSQLDHILVPEKSTVHEIKVIHELNGSDHYPISLRVDI